MLTINQHSNISYLSCANFILLTLGAASLVVPHVPGMVICSFFISAAIISLRFFELRLASYNLIFYNLLLLYPLYTLVTYLLTAPNFILKDLDKIGNYLLIVPSVWLFSKYKINYNFFIKGTVVAGMLNLSLALYQNYFLQIRSHGVVNAIAFGDFSLLFAIFSLILALSYPKKIIYWLGFVGNLIASILSQTRGGWLALPIVFYFLLNNLQVKLKYRIIFLLLISGSVLLFKELLLDRMLEIISDIMQYYNSHNVLTSLGIRLELWRASFIMMQDNWLWGIGYKQFVPHIQVLQQQGIISPLEVFANSHSDYIMILAEQGIGGLLFLLAPFIFTTYLLIKYKNIISYHLYANTAVFLFMCAVFSLSQCQLLHNLTQRFILFTLIIFTTSILHEIYHWKNLQCQNQAYQ